MELSLATSAMSCRTIASVKAEHRLAVVARLAPRPSRRRGRQPRQRQDAQAGQRVAGGGVERRPAASRGRWRGGTAPIQSPRVDLDQSRWPSLPLARLTAARTPPGEVPSNEAAASVSKPRMATSMSAARSRVGSAAICRSTSAHSSTTSSSARRPSVGWDRCERRDLKRSVANRRVATTSQGRTLRSFWTWRRARHRRTKASWARSSAAAQSLVHDSAKRNVGNQFS
jgi:hypothetical protein